MTVIQRTEGYEQYITGEIAKTKHVANSNRADCWSIQELLGTQGFSVRKSPY